MGTSQRIVTTALWVVAVMGMLAIVGSGLWAAHRSAGDPAYGMRDGQAIPAEGPSIDSPGLFNLPQFKLVDQDGNDFPDTRLRGHVWIGSFIFTHCAGPCPIILGKIAKLQRTIEDPNIKFVSFTVDPVRDTPDVLKKRAQLLGAQEGRWFFLTGDKDVVHQVLHEMLQPKPVAETPGSDQVLHDTHLYLFDATGNCRARYSIYDDGEMTKLPKDAAALAAKAGDKGAS